MNSKATKEFSEINIRLKEQRSESILQGYIGPNIRPIVFT
jgi:hypothetical protein